MVSQLLRTTPLIQFFLFGCYVIELIIVILLTADHRTLNSGIQQLREFVAARGKHRNHTFEAYHKRILSSRKFVYEFLLANTSETPQQSNN